MRTSRLTGAVLATALILTGCGDDDRAAEGESSSVASSPIATEAEPTDSTSTEPASSTESDLPSEPAEPAPTPGDGVRADLTPDAEVPGPGDTGGAGRFEATLELQETGGELCYTLDVVGLSSPATAAHIHTGTQDESGGVLVTLTAPADGVVTDCIALNATELIPLLEDPGAHYVNVHTADFPEGAVRGQLQAAG